LFVKRLPWHDTLWEELWSEPCLPPALLFKGQTGIGKHLIADRLAQALLCENRLDQNQPCGVCMPCRWFKVGSHPDFFCLEPKNEGERDAASRMILIEQVRELRDKLALCSHQGSLRIALIHPAEAMTVSAANALLKILEESPQDTLFILVSHRPHLLMPTVMSRCRQLTIPTPDPLTAVCWLREQGVAHPDLALAHAGYSPIMALQSHGQEECESRRVFFLKLAVGAGTNPLELADLCQKMSLEEALRLLSHWVYDLLLYKFVKQTRYHFDFSESIKRLSDALDTTALIRYYRELLSAQRLAGHPLNPRLFLEQLCVSYCRLFTQ
jgi:DNA polymerase III subunit delta'